MGAEVKSVVEEEEEEEEEEGLGTPMSGKSFIASWAYSGKLERNLGWALQDTGKQSWVAFGDR